MYLEQIKSTFNIFLCLKTIYDECEKVFKTSMNLCIMHPNMIKDSNISFHMTQQFKICLIEKISYDLH